MKKPLFLYANLGTPASTSTKDVRKYLREFLSDPMVIDIPAFFRWVLVNLIIAPIRAPRSAQAYRKVWMPEGSPLMVYSQGTANKLAAKIPNADVELVMRYGEPGIATVLKRYLSKPEGERPDEIYVFPAYPQYALSSSETAIQAVRNVLFDFNFRGTCKIIAHYEVYAPFIEAVAARTQKVMSEKNCDYLLFSFHGLPMRQIAKVAPDLNYRDQCYATAHAVAKKLGIPQAKYSVGFQSRLGTGWIKPYSDQLFVELAKSGVKNLAVACPSFTADCLETLEEIAIGGHEIFVEAGGDDLTLVPCVNDGDDWVAAVAQLYKDGPWRAINA
jgi:protoporphyrin/coproporphyrin ferrochelatase